MNGQRIFCLIMIMILGVITIYFGITEQYELGKYSFLLGCCIMVIDLTLSLKNANTQSGEKGNRE